VVKEQKIAIPPTVEWVATIELRYFTFKTVTVKTDLDTEVTSIGVRRLQQKWVQHVYYGQEDMRWVIGAEEWRDVPEVEE